MMPLWRHFYEYHNLTFHFMEQALNISLNFTVFFSDHDFKFLNRFIFLSAFESSDAVAHG